MYFNNFKTASSDVLYEEVSSFPDVTWAYFIVAVSNLCVAITFACIVVASFYHNKANGIEKENKESNEEQKPGQSNKKTTFRF